MTDVRAGAATRTPTQVAPGWRWVFVAGAVGVACLVLVGALFFGGGRPAGKVPGLPDAGALVEWSLPIARLLLDLLALVTVGLVATAALLLPAGRDGLTATALRYLRRVSLFASMWAVAALLTALLSLADLAGLPLSQALSLSQLGQFVTQIAPGQALALEAFGAVVLAATAPLVVSRGGAFALLVTALGALLPRTLTGHSSASSSHDLAVTSLYLHVAGVCLWVGGLVVLVDLARRSPRLLATATPRFSRLALWCFVTVAASGVVNAAIRLGSWSGLTTRYGVLVVCKALFLLTLGVFGWWHRQHTVPQMAVGRVRMLFARIATVEVLVMLGAVGLGVGLSRTPPPERIPDSNAFSAARDLLGYPLPPAPTLGRLLFDIRPDPVFLILVTAGAVGYVAGLRRLRARSIDWPVGRTFAWFGGLFVIALCTWSGLNRYGPVLFSVHMVQHMLLSMLAPLLLASGAPITLALRALPSERAGGSGARETLLAVLHSKPFKILTHPLVALAIFVSSFYALYFTGIFEWAMRHHSGHLLMTAHFLIAGSLLFWPLVSPDPMPIRLPYVARMAVLFAVIPFHAFFGIALMSSTSVIAESYYQQLDRPYATDLLADQHLGGGIAWGFGELPTVITLGLIFLLWMRSDDREARRQDRAEGTAHDPLEAYNAHLADLARRSEEDRPRA